MNSARRLLSHPLDARIVRNLQALHMIQIERKLTCLTKASLIRLQSRSGIVQIEVEANHEANLDILGKITCSPEQKYAAIRHNRKEQRIRWHLHMGALADSRFDI